MTHIGDKGIRRLHMWSFIVEWLITSITTRCVRCKGVNKEHVFWKKKKPIWSKLFLWGILFAALFLFHIHRKSILYSHIKSAQKTKVWQEEFTFCSRMHLVKHSIQFLETNYPLQSLCCSLERTEHQEMGKPGSVPPKGRGHIFLVYFTFLELSLVHDT